MQIAVEKRMKKCMSCNHYYRYAIFFNGLLRDIKSVGNRPNIVVIIVRIFILVNLTRYFQER